MRKVTARSLSWQRKAFKTTSRLCCAEQGVEDVLSGGVGTGSSVLGSSQQGKGIFGIFVWPGSTVLCSVAVAPYHAPSPEERELCFRLE